MGFGAKSKAEKLAEKEKANDQIKKAHQEDVSWAENDKNVSKKMARAADKDAKADAAAEKAAEKKRLEEEDNADLGAHVAKNAPKKAAPKKMTQQQIALAAMAAQLNEKKNKKTAKTVAVDQDAAVYAENTNRTNDIDAMTVEDALKQLEVSNEDKPQKYTYAKFENEMMDHVKSQNPDLKRNALKERVFKLWERSPLNPKNEGTRG